MTIARNTQMKILVPPLFAKPYNGEVQDRQTSLHTRLQANDTGRELTGSSEWYKNFVCHQCIDKYNYTIWHPTEGLHYYDDTNNQKIEETEDWIDK